MNASQATSYILAQTGFAAQPEQWLRQVRIDKGPILHQEPLGARRGLQENEKENGPPTGRHTGFRDHGMVPPDAELLDLKPAQGDGAMPESTMPTSAHAAQRMILETDIPVLSDTDACSLRQG